MKNNAIFASYICIIRLKSDRQVDGWVDRQIRQTNKQPDKQTTRQLGRDK